MARFASRPISHSHPFCIMTDDRVTLPQGLFLHIYTVTTSVGAAAAAWTYLSTHAYPQTNTSRRGAAVSPRRRRCCVVCRVQSVPKLLKVEDPRDE
jgi:hypothetical protein